MQRKTFLIAAMTVTAALAGFVVADTAFGATWHEYEGRVSAGQAYLVPVPKGGEVLSFALVPTGDAPAAQLVVFDAEDARVGHFALDEGTESSDIVDPLAGDYVVFVYELREAQLSIRLEAREPGDLVLQKAEVTRADKAILKNFEGNLSKEFTVNVKQEPVFATLLYQGQVENLNAVIESPAGIVMTVTGESGTSYAPGLGVGGASAREADLGNLAKGAFKVHASADAIDGSLYLTTLSYARPAAPVPAVEAEPDAAHPKHGKHGGHARAAPPAPPMEPVTPEGAPLKAGVPTAVQVTQPSLLLALPSYFKVPCVPAEETEDDENGTDDEETPEPSACPKEHDDHEDHSSPPAPYGPGYYGSAEEALVVVYDAMDNLVGVFVLGGEEDSVLIEELTLGEHVVFVHGRASDEPAAYLVDPAMPEAPIEHRELALVESQIALDHAFFGAENKAELTDLVTPPLAFWSYVTGDTLGADYRATLEGPEGLVFERYDPVVMSSWGYEYGYGYTDPTMLVAGDYVFRVDTLAATGSTVLGYLTYDRGDLQAEIVAEEVAADEGKDKGDDSGEGTTGAIAPVPGVPGVPGLPGIPSVPVPGFG